MQKNIQILAVNRQALIRQLTAAALVLCLVAACGGGDHPNPGPNNNNNPDVTPDYTSNFTGTWQGHVTTTINGQSTTVNILQPVTALGSKNRFRWEDSVCPINWTADSAAHSTADRVDGCSISQSGCTIRLAVTSGSFVRDGDGARGSLAGSVTVGSGCIPSSGTVYTYSMNTDLMTRTQGGRINAESDPVDSSFMPGSAEIFSALSADFASFAIDSQH